LELVGDNLLQGFVWKLICRYFSDRDWAAIDEEHGCLVDVEVLAKLD
jgi:hypothetical protein